MHRDAPLPTDLERDLQAERVALIMSAKLSAGGPPLEPGERASPDQLPALELNPWRHALANAYEQAAHGRTACDVAGAHPDDLRARHRAHAGRVVSPQIIRYRIHGSSRLPPGAAQRQHVSTQSNRMPGSAPVIAEQPGTIEMSMGKARRVIDRRPNR